MPFDTRDANRKRETPPIKVVAGNVLGKTQTATLVVESKYQGFDQSTAYAADFLLAMASVICIVVVSIQIRNSARYATVSATPTRKRVGKALSVLTRARP